MTEGEINRKPGTFIKGDKRINRKGRPKNFDALRRLALDVAHRQAMDAEDKPILIDNMPITVIESVMLSWAQSGEPALQKAFVEIAFGKVPNVTEITGKDGEPVTFRVIYERKRNGNSDPTA